MAEEVGRCMNRVVELVRKIEKNNKRCGYKEGNERKINLSIQGQVYVDEGFVRRKKNVDVEES